MTYRTAIAQLIQNIEALDGLYLEAAYGRFTHIPELDPDEPSRARAFTVVGNGAGVKNLSAGSVQRDRMNQVTLHVAYPHEEDGRRLDDVIWDDYETLTNDLLDQSGWNRPTSTILAVSSGESLITPATAPTVETDRHVGRVLRVNFILQHRNS